MKTHTIIGYNILKESKRAILRAAAIIAYQHHEKWDGNGYPRGLRSDEIHLYGRIVALVDVFDAMTSDRVYRKGMPLKKVLDMLRQSRGTHFDPRLLDLFMNNLEKFVAIHEKHAEGSCPGVLQPEPVLATRDEDLLLPV